MLKDKLKNNELTIGSWVTIGHPSIVEIMATAGFDWLAVDMEHSAIELETAQNLIAAIQANKMEALVRVGKNDDLLIKRVLDIGADGVIIPMVNTKADAEKAVASVRYPPLGKRGVGLYRAQKYGTGFDEYRKWQEESSIIIVQIEHKDAVDNLVDILSVKGIDGIIIGPYDLSASLGVPGDYENDAVKKAISKVEQICKKNNMPLGAHVIESNAAKLQEKIDQGYKFISFSIDFLFLGDKAREEMGKAGL